MVRHTALVKITMETRALKLKHAVGIPEAFVPGLHLDVNSLKNLLQLRMSHLVHVSVSVCVRHS